MYIGDGNLSLKGKLAKSRNLEYWKCEHYIDWLPDEAKKIIFDLPKTREWRILVAAEMNQFRELL